jgi:hypothetical protein
LLLHALCGGEHAVETVHVGHVMMHWKGGEEQL